MKLKTIITIAFAIICFATFGQTTKGKLYKTDHWADIKRKGGWVNAMDNPTYEKVEILKTSKQIKVTFGTKVYNYTIVSEKIFSEVMMNYTVTLNGKNYTLRIADMENGTHAVTLDDGITKDGVWMVSDIKDISTIDVK